MREYVGHPWRVCTSNTLITSRFWRLANALAYADSLMEDVQGTVTDEMGEPVYENAAQREADAVHAAFCRWCP